MAKYLWGKEKLEDGDEIYGAVDYCPVCGSDFGGSFTRREAIYFQGECYHYGCYVKAVNVHLATKKLKENKKKEN